VGRRLRLRHLWLLIPFWIAAWRAGRTIGDNSFLWHVRTGLDQSLAGEVIRTDPYSFTKAGEPWRTQSWLIELGYARLEDWFGDLRWVPVFLFFAIGLVLVVVLAGLLRSGTSLMGAAIVLFLVSWVFQPYMSPRPVLVSYVIFALVGLVVAARKPPLWVVPGLLWLWASVHGSFIVGLGVLVLDAMRRRDRRSWLAVGVGVVAVSVTAHGLAIWEILYRFAINREGLEGIQEWLPPDFTNYALVATLPLLGLLMVGLATQRIEVGALWILIPMVAFALLSTRNVLPALLVMAPWLGASATVVPELAEQQLKPPLVWLTAAAIIISGVALVARPAELRSGRFPSRDLVTSLGTEPVFHRMASGGAIIYYEGSARQVFVDDRVELYGSEFLAAQRAASAGDEWRALFAEWDIAQVLLHEDEVLVRRLVDDGWTACEADDEFLVLKPVCGP
jgi:hypothetical protein